MGIGIGTHHTNKLGSNLITRRRIVNLAVTKWAVLHPRNRCTYCDPHYGTINLAIKKLALWGIVMGNVQSDIPTLQLPNWNFESLSSTDWHQLTLINWGVRRNLIFPEHISLTAYLQLLALASNFCILESCIYQLLHKMSRKARIISETSQADNTCPKIWIANRGYSEYKPDLKTGRLRNDSSFSAHFVQRKKLLVSC